MARHTQAVFYGQKEGSKEGNEGMKGERKRQREGE